MIFPQLFQLLFLLYDTDNHKSLLISARRPFDWSGSSVASVEMCDYLDDVFTIQIQELIQEAFAICRSLRSLSTGPQRLSRLPPHFRVLKDDDAAILNGALLIHIQEHCFTGPTNCWIALLVRFVLPAESRCWTPRYLQRTVSQRTCSCKQLVSVLMGSQRRSRRGSATEVESASNSE
jgi:hypothetical protein